jgi:predicted acetyltransferase
MPVSLIAAWQSAPAARVFANLWPMYVHEITAFATDFYALDESGVWQPDLICDWTAPVTPPANLRETVSATDARQPLQRTYVIAADDRAVGFACLGLAPFRYMPTDADVIVCELFVVRRVRGGGVAAAALTELLALHPGRWMLRAIHDNARAIAFWRRALASAPIEALSSRREGGDVVWRFVVGPVEASPP